MRLLRYFAQDAERTVNRRRFRVHQMRCYHRDAECRRLLVSGAERVIELMDHVSKSGAAKLVLGCDLPLTGKAVVSRIITDLGVFDVTGTGFAVVELADDVDYQDVVDKTTAPVTDDRQRREPLERRAWRKRG